MLTTTQTDLFIYDSFPLTFRKFQVGDLYFLIRNVRIIDET